MSIYVQGILTLTWRETRPSISVHCNDNKAANTAIASVSSALIIITMSIPSPIFIQSEWARLATVVVSQCEVAFPSLDSGMQGHMDILPSDPDLDWSAALGKDFAQVFPDRAAAFIAERDAFAKLLESHGIQVLRPRLLTEAEKTVDPVNKYCNYFCRDPWFNVGNCVIEGSLRWAYRRREVLPCREIFEAHVMSDDSCMYVSVPVAEVSGSHSDSESKGIFLEGGDVMVFGKHILVGHSGHASNPAGARWLQKLLRPQGYTIEVVPLASDFLHLDCAIGPIREGLALVCKEALPDGLPSVLKDWDLIDVTRSEAQRLATNGLPLGPELYVTDPAFKRLGDLVQERGVQVEYVDFQVTRAFGGSFRCTTQPLSRR